MSLQHTSFYKHVELYIPSPQIVFAESDYNPIPLKNYVEYCANHKMLRHLRACIPMKQRPEIFQDFKCVTTRLC